MIVYNEYIDDVKVQKNGKYNSFSLIFHKKPVQFVVITIKFSNLATTNINLIIKE